MHGDLIPGRSFWARSVSTLFSTLKDVKKLVAITTTKEPSRCFRKSMKKYLWNHHAWKSQNPKMTKIGDSFVVDISKMFTFSGMFVWNLPEPSVIRDTQKVSSGTTMRRACELVARQGLLCRGASKIDVCSSVRPSVRPPSAAFLDSFETGQMELPKAKRSKIGSKMVQKCDIDDLW